MNFYQNLSVFFFVFLWLPSINECVQCQMRYSRTLSKDEQFFERNSTENRKFCSVSITYAFLNERFLIEFDSNYANEENMFYIQMELSPSHPFVYMRYDCSTDQCDQIFVRETLRKDMIWVETPDLYDSLLIMFYHDDSNEQYVSCLEKKCLNNQSCQVERSLTRFQSKIKITAECTEISNETRGNFELNYTYSWIVDAISQSLRVNCDQKICSERENLTNALVDASDQIHQLFEETFSLSSNEPLKKLFNNKSPTNFDCRLFTVFLIYLFLKN